MGQDTFISYSRIDLPFVEHLDTFLTAAGVSTWFDQKSLLPGQKWEDEIDDQISASSVFLTCLSQQAIGRPGFFHKEQQIANETALRLPSDRKINLNAGIQG